MRTQTLAALPVRAESGLRNRVGSSPILGLKATVLSFIEPLNKWVIQTSVNQGDRHDHDPYGMRPQEPQVHSLPKRLRYCGPAR